MLTSSFLSLSQIPELATNFLGWHWAPAPLSEQFGRNRPESLGTAAKDVGCARCRARNSYDCRRPAGCPRPSPNPRPRLKPDPAQELDQDPRRVLGIFVDEEMPDRQRGLAQIGASFLLGGADIEILVHGAFRPPEGKRGTGEPGRDVGSIMLEVYGGRRAIVGAGAVDHCRIAPAAPILGQQLRIEVLNSGCTPAQQAGLV